MDAALLVDGGERVDVPELIMFAEATIESLQQALTAATSHLHRLIQLRDGGPGMASCMHPRKRLYRGTLADPTHWICDSCDVEGSDV